MCKKVNSPTWNIHPEQRCPVGFIDKENRFILLSEGEDPEGQIFNLWIPTEDNNLYIIDKLSKKNGIWAYKRQFECFDLNCISNTFLNAINPDY